jgi:hypothetical protein
VDALSLDRRVELRREVKQLWASSMISFILVNNEDMVYVYTNNQPIYLKIYMILLVMLINTVKSMSTKRECDFPFHHTC